MSLCKAVAQKYGYIKFLIMHGMFQFHFVLNVAVGGTSGFIPDDVINRGGASPKPWKNSDSDLFTKFWDARGHWYETWDGENAAMQVDWIKVYQKSAGNKIIIIIS